MDMETTEKQGKGQKGKEKRLSQEKKQKHKTASTDLEEPAAKKTKRDSSVSEAGFSYIRFKFLLRSPETVVTGLQSFLDLCGEEDEEDEEAGRVGLELLESYLKSSPHCSEVLDLLTPSATAQQSYLKSSPHCSEVLDLLTPSATAQQISLVFAWMKMALQKCPSVSKTFSDLQQHLIKTLMTRHAHLIINSLRWGNKTGFVKSTLMLLITITCLSDKFSKLLHTCLDFTHANWPDLLSRRDRKVDVDIRACMVAVLMRLLKTEDEELTRSLVDQRGLLQDVMLGLKYDRSEYAVHSLNTIHECIVLNGTVGKNSKIYLFNSPVLKELLALYRWPGPSQWKRQATDDEKEEYTEEQQEVAECVHPLLVDLLTNHKLGICFRDKSYGIAHENKNPAVSKVLQSLVTSYTTPLSHLLVTTVLHACPDQVPAFLKQLHPHLAPRPVHTWVACLHFFLKIVESHEWPEELTGSAAMMSEERASQVVHFLFPPEGVLTSLKEGLKSACATVRDQCLRAVEVVVSRGRHFYHISKSKLGDQAPLTLGIEGFISKTLPNGQLMLNLLQKLYSADSFAVLVARDSLQNKEVAVPHVSRFQHLVSILRMYTLAPEHLTGGPADTLPRLLQLVTQMVESEEEIDQPPDGTPGNLPSLCLLQALSECDARKLNLFGKGGSKGDSKNSLVFQLVCLMQSQNADDTCTHLALSCIVKLLAGTGLFEGHTGELSVWLRQLRCSGSAPGKVVAYFVGLLRQYMSNPYPAIDRLLELVEGSSSSQLTDGLVSGVSIVVVDRLLELVEGSSSQLTDGLGSGVRQEFSPLVMFALDGEFHVQKKVHQYVCSVLIDLLHTLHKPWGFSRLVHSLSSKLDPEVTLYLTLHSTEEKMTSASMSKRTCKKLRMKQLKTFKHAGVALMKKLVKEEGEINEAVEDLPAGSCLPLAQLCLRYLDDLVFGSTETQGELQSRRLAEVCVETLKAASLCLASATTTATNKEDESMEETETTMSEPKLPQLDTDCFKPLVTCVLNHPLISHWLLEEGFKQGNTPREELVIGLCDVVHSMKVGDGNIQLPFDVTSKCRHMLQAASESGHVAESVQPLLRQCLDALFSVGGPQSRLEGLLTLASLPADSFISQSSHTPTPLAESVCRLTDAHLPDGDALKELSARVDLKSSLRGLFGLVSVLDNAALVSLTLALVRSDPDLASACTVKSFRSLVRRVEKEKCRASLQQLLGTLMTHNARCRATCRLWLQRMETLKPGRGPFHSFMLLYLRLFLTVEESASEDSAVIAMGKLVSQTLISGQWAVSQMDTTFLKVVCYLVNYNVLESASIDKVQAKLLSAMGKGSHLYEAHVQLLAATVRHQSLRAYHLQQEGDNPGREQGSETDCWKNFESRAGQVFLAGVRYLTSSSTRSVGGDDEDGESRSRCLLLDLCQDLLCLPLHSDVKVGIASCWSAIISSCLKCHYTEVQYIALLKRLVQILYAEEEQTTKDVEDMDDGEAENVTENLTQESSDENSDSEDEEDDDDDSKPDTSKEDSPTKKSATTPQRTSLTHKTLNMIVSETAKRLGLGEKSAYAKKLIALYGEGRETTCSTRRSKIVGRWTDPVHQSYFLWPSESILLAFERKMALASGSGGSRLVGLCEQVVGHGSFLSVMQEGEGGVRGEVVSLLVCLVRLEATCCRVLPLSVLVAAYGASLSLTDQNLLYLMFACDLYGTQRFSPGLWGAGAVKQQEDQRDVGRSLRQETNLDTILHLLDPDRLATSILHFPMLRTMQFHQLEYTEKAERMMSRDDCYDPRFLLQLFFHFMGPEHVVDVRTFVERKGLGFTLAALSSHDTLTRQMAIGVLANLHSHLDMARRWSAAPNLTAFLKVVMNGMTKESQKLPCVITVFLAKAADFVMTPESDMYVATHSFLMLKPALDINNVPEFYNFFNSPNPKERVWILRLLQDGLRETSDHRLCQRRFVYKLLMCHASSSLSDPQTRRESLKVLVQACSMASVVKDLVTRHALLPWLLTFITHSLSDTAEMTRVVCRMLHSVCYTCEFHRYRLWWLSLSRLARRQLLYLPLLACVQLLLDSFSHLEAESLSMLEDILQHPYIAATATTTAPLLSVESVENTTGNRE
ncbi:hypothetical protein ACOMHN_040148 [Nucella lapillus]